MKKLTIAVIVCLVVATFCYAQGARNPFYGGATLPQTTFFSSIGVTGADVTGNPGFLMLQGPNNTEDADGVRNYVLWIDQTGDLCMASYTTIDNYASFPSGDWDDDSMGSACTKVGAQS